MRINELNLKILLISVAMIIVAGYSCSAFSTGSSPGSGPCGGKYWGPMDPNGIEVGDDLLTPGNYILNYAYQKKTLNPENQMKVPWSAWKTAGPFTLKKERKYIIHFGEKATDQPTDPYLKDEHLWSDSQDSYMSKMAGYAGVNSALSDYRFVFCWTSAPGGGSVDTDDDEDTGGSVMKNCNVYQKAGSTLDNLQYCCRYFDGVSLQYVCESKNSILFEICLKCSTNAKRSESGKIIMTG